jgi:thioredoxin-related protein
MQKKTIILTAILCISISICFAQSTIRFEKDSYEQSIQKAQKENKLVTLYFTGSGCALCKKMEKEVFVAPEIYNLYNTNFVNVESYDDWDKPDAKVKALRKKFNIISNPTFLFLDKDENIVHRSQGGTKDLFLTVGKQATGEDNYHNWTKKIAAGDYSTEIVAKYLSVELPTKFYSEQNFVCPAQTVLDNYFTNIPEKEYSLKANWNIINKHVYNTESGVFKYLVANQALFNEKFGKVAVDKKLFEVYYLNWSGNMSSDD